jgi:phosphoesterase RecJ-like protein
MLIDKVVAKLKQYDEILLIIHENPDGDTLAAAITLSEALKKMGKNPSMICKDSVPKPFQFLLNYQEISHDLLFGDFELILVIDCGDLKRTGFDERLKKMAKKKKTIINIDHHPKNDLHKIATVNLVDFKASSTSEIIWELLEKLQVEIDKEMATTLLTGLYTDTGGFKHSNTSPKTLKIAAELLRLGAKIKLITKNVSFNRTIPSMKLWGVVLNRLKKQADLSIVYSVITKDDLLNCGADYDDIAGVVNLINSIPDAKAAILFYETEDNKIRASVRTESDGVDVSRLANLFGGGGHKKASGFTLDGHFKIKENDWEIVLK